MVANYSHSHGFIKFEWPSWIAQFKTFFSNFYELILAVALVVGFSSYLDFQQNSRLKLVSDPQINDFYFVDYYKINPSSDAKYRYYPMKITAIDGQNITFRVGNIGHSEKVSITEHVKLDSAMQRNFYRKDAMTLTAVHLTELAKEGVVYDIARPENIYINGWIVMGLNELVVE